MNINLAVEKIRDAILDEITSGVRSEVNSVSESVVEAVDFADEALRQLDEYTFSENVGVEIRDRVNEIIEDDLEKLIEEMKEENEKVKWENHGTIMTLNYILQYYPLGSIVIAMPYSEQEVQGSPAFYLIDRIANEASGEKCLRRVIDMYAIPTSIHQDSKYVFFDSIHLLNFVDNLIERFNLKE